MWLVKVVVEMPLGTPLTLSFLGGWGGLGFYPLHQCKITQTFMVECLKSKSCRLRLSGKAKALMD